MQSWGIVPKEFVNEYLRNNSQGFSFCSWWEMSQCFAITPSWLQPYWYLIDISQNIDKVVFPGFGGNVSLLWVSGPLPHMYHSLKKTDYNCYKLYIMEFEIHTCIIDWFMTKNIFFFNFIGPFQFHRPILDSLAYNNFIGPFQTYSPIFEFIGLY